MSGLNGWRQIWFWPLAPQAEAQWQAAARLTLEVEVDNRTLALRAALPRVEVVKLATGGAVLVVEADFGSSSATRPLERPDLSVEDPVGTARRRAVSVDDVRKVSDILRRGHAKVVWLDDDGRPLPHPGLETPPGGAMPLVSLLDLPAGTPAAEWTVLFRADDVVRQDDLADGSRRLVLKGGHALIGGTPSDDIRAREEALVLAALGERLALDALDARLTAALASDDDTQDRTLLAIEQDTLRRRLPLPSRRALDPLTPWRQALGLEEDTAAFAQTLEAALAHAQARRHVRHAETGQSFSVIVSVGLVVLVIVSALGMNTVLAQEILQATVRRVHLFLVPGRPDLPHIGLVSLYVHLTAVLLITAAGGWLGRTVIDALVSERDRLGARVGRFLGRLTGGTLWTAVVLFLFVFFMTR
ncbi:hypothetical protein [Pararhodospirillum photometricum]|uniref:Uncharacterized protein n=1 Tax=Pararhodospirillum photometricum DSM 122 TaxID=1150469 RepID=H6SR55_PARPM|nr:hypothetical protein [Pararhodospirillum photometricum]CCG09777.1 unnamed protein product [Pararhodospirillum photometricum DSM 122]